MFFLIIPYVTLKLFTLFSISFFIIDISHTIHLLVNSFLIWGKYLFDTILLFIIGKYVKSRFKNRGSPCYFLSSKGQKINNITKIEHTRLFLFTLLVSFVTVFLAQKLIYIINIWFNFVPGSFFGQDYLLNLMFMWKDDLNMHLFQDRKSDWWFSPTNFWLPEDPSIVRILSEKKNGGMGLLSRKTEALCADLKKRAEAATSSYSAEVNFPHCIYLALVAKNH